MTTVQQLSGKIALVTGASRGIGRAIAKRLAGDGALVTVNYATNSDAAESLIAEIAAAGGEAFAVQARLGTGGETARLFARMEEDLRRREREVRLDVLVNNAGTGHFGRISETTEQKFDELFAANTKAPFLVTTHALKYLAAGGRVINISSGASRRPGTVLGLYSMTKAAVDAMTLAFAAELGSRGITVNTVAPGWIATEGNAAAREDPATVRNVEGQTALGRLGTPEDIARVVAFLASGDGGWVTGQYIEASGGFKLLQPANIATAGGCLASQYLAGWVIARLEGVEAAERALHYVAPVGEKEEYVARAIPARSQATV